MRFRWDLTNKTGKIAQKKENNCQCLARRKISNKSFSENGGCLFIEMISTTEEISSTEDVAI